MSTITLTMVVIAVKTKTTIKTRTTIVILKKSLLPLALKNKNYSKGYVAVISITNIHNILISRV